MNRKITQRELMDVQAMRSLVKGIEDELQEIKPQVLKDSVKGSSAEFPYTQHTIVVEGEVDLEKNPMYKRLKRELDEARTEWLEKIREVEQYLRDMDPETQDILRRYYVNGQTLTEIGEALGYSKSAIHKKINACF